MLFLDEMDNRDKRFTRDQMHHDKNKKTNHEKTKERQDKDSTLPIDTETATITSTNQEDSEYSERVRQKKEHRKSKDRSHHRGHKSRSNNEEQKGHHNNHVHHEESGISEQKEREHSTYEKEDLEKKKSKHKNSKEQREYKESRKGTHQSPTSFPDDKKCRGDGHESTNKSRQKVYHITSKSINEKLRQLSDTGEKSDEEDDVDNKTMENCNNSKPCVHGGVGDRYEDEVKIKRENNSGKTNEDEETKGSRVSKRNSTKPKHNLRDKLKRTLSDHREHMRQHSRDSKDSERKHRQKKRTDSQRERKKDNCRKCKKHVEKPDQQRAYYSDSELDCGNVTNMTINDRTSDHCEPIRHCEPPLDTITTYHPFDTTTKEKCHKGEGVKDSAKQKTDHTRKTEPLLCDKCRKSDRISKRSKSPSETSIRGKLISALFQRIKALSKETEDLRQDRNELKDKLSIMTTEYEIFRERKELNSEQEQQKQQKKIENLPEDVRIPDQGAFREEVHQILENIQRKYQNHWKEHEHKIHQVQNDAENEIQSLMRNIVTKYVEIGEIKDRNELVANMLPLKNIAEPLYISTKLNVEAATSTRNQATAELYEMHPTYNIVKNKKELLLKVVDPMKPCTSNRHPSLQSICRENIMKAGTSQGYQERNPYADLNNDRSTQRELSTIPRFVYANTNKYNFGTNDALSGQNGSKNEQIKEKLPVGTPPDENKVHFHPATTSGETKIPYRTKKYFPIEKNTNDNAPTKSTEHEYLTKKDTKEFWRQKLSQPTMTESTREVVDNYRPIENKRNVN